MIQIISKNATQEASNLGGFNYSSLKKPEITFKKVLVAKIKIENEEYRMLRKKFDEDLFHIEKKPDGWYITEKE
ncbi:hypothetical protein [Neobacillus niacini]|uniref:hypothetical protein n=1 Tax=Neobacillus niacini TaxID=86668 RepID=UPI002FFE11FE